MQTVSRLIEWLLGRNRPEPGRDPAEPLLAAGGYGNLYEANLAGAVLRGADLESVVLSGAALSGADLRGAKLVRTRLVNADLAGADLTGACLREANLTGADLRGAVLADADLTRALLAGARYDGRTRWPACFDPAEQGARRVDPDPQAGG
jgi:uncharacterized protein YjbI with pentapeptide repeats